MSTYHAKKRLGQNFLTSERIIQRLVDLIAPKPDQVVVEIGAGRGALTYPLCQSGAKVWAIEFDRDLIGYLERKLDQFQNVTVLARDFLAFHPEVYDLKEFLLVGNIPYNITSPVIDWCIHYRERLTGAYFMVQKELAKRLTATPGTHDWSPLSISAQLHFDITYCFDVPAHAFTPPPEVVSGFVHLRPIPVRAGVDLGWLDRVVRVSFRQRRKQLVNNLVPGLATDPAQARAILKALGFPEQARAEELTIEQFCLLANHLVPKESNDHC